MLTAAEITAICTVAVSFSTALVTLFGHLHRRRLEQAENISAWEGTRHHPDNPDNHDQKAFIANNSRAPIFDVAISYGVNHGRGRAYSTGNDHHVFIAIVPPGTFVTDLPPVPSNITDQKLGLSISFRDLHGRYWRRDATGRLHTTKNPWANLKIDSNFDSWAEIERA